MFSPVLLQFERQAHPLRVLTRAINVCRSCKVIFTGLVLRPHRRASSFAPALGGRADNPLPAN